MGKEEIPPEEKLWAKVHDNILPGTAMEAVDALHELLGQIRERTVELERLEKAKAYTEETCSLAGKEVARAVARAEKAETQAERLTTAANACLTQIQEGGSPPPGGLEIALPYYGQRIRERAEKAEVEVERLKGDGAYEKGYEVSADKCEEMAGALFGEWKARAEKAEADRDAYRDALQLAIDDPIHIPAMPKLERGA